MDRSVLIPHAAHTHPGVDISGIVLTLHLHLSILERPQTRTIKPYLTPSLILPRVLEPGRGTFILGSSFLRASGSSPNGFQPVASVLLIQRFLQVMQAPLKI